jgi:ketosteroid isomerase-like protein
MSEENVEIVRTFIDAFNRDDWDAVLQDLAPSFEYDASRALGPFRGVYHLDEMRGLLDDLADLWESNRYEAEEFIEVGEHVVTPFTNYLRGRDGIEVTARATFSWTIRERAIVRMCLYQERQEALEAAGLSE